MADILTWPAVVMGVFTALNASVLVPVARSWSRNRESGKKRDATARDNAERVEAAMKEFGGQVLLLNQSVWAASGDARELAARVTALEREASVRDAAWGRELEHMRREFERGRR